MHAQAVTLAQRRRLLAAKRSRENVVVRGSFLCYAVVCIYTQMHAYMCLCAFVYA
jgi:hypothetical protein